MCKTLSKWRTSRILKATDEGMITKNKMSCAIENMASFRPPNEKSNKKNPMQKQKASATNKGMKITAQLVCGMWSTPSLNDIKITKGIKTVAKQNKGVAEIMYFFCVS